MGDSGGMSIPSSPASPRFVVIGAGSRGHAYARGVTAVTSGVIAAVAEPDPFKNDEFGRKYIWGDQGRAGPGQAFASWQDWIEWEMQRRRQKGHNTSHRTVDGADHVEGHDHIPITGVFICTLDQTHAGIIHALAPLNLHILCEKPLALSLHDCLAISQSLSHHPPKIFSIGHVLRYSPHNILLRKLLVEDQAIGEVVSIEHTEPVGWWHFAHSYVRGNWRRQTAEGVGSLLTKSCHDVDFLMWLLCSPSVLTGHTPHLPSTVSSSGSITQFRRARKPVAAGKATNCFDCQLGDQGCIYSAQKIYRDKWLRQEKYTGWPLKIVVPEMEDIVQSRGWDAADKRLEEALREDYDVATTADAAIEQRSWYGRCVYESDNNVNDEQTLVITWDDDPVPTPSANGSVDGVSNMHVDGTPNGTTTTTTTSPSHDPLYGRGPKTAIFHMTSPTQAQCIRRGKIYGTLGEMSYDSSTITIHSFTTGQTTVHTLPKQAPEVEASHGGGDWGLAKAFVDAVEAVDTGRLDTKTAQWEYVGCDLEECVRSHALVFCAEEARRQKKVVDWGEWWAQSGIAAA